MSILEVLISILIIVVASIGTLSYFASTRGYVEKTGNRRAAIERARQRLDQLMASLIEDLPPKDGDCYYCAAGATALCAFTDWKKFGPVCPSSLPDADSDSVSVGSLAAAMRRETTARFIDDPAAGTDDPITGATIRDVFEFGVKVWFLGGSADDDFSRVQMRTLRRP